MANLPLTDLNVANNHFSRWIPRELISIPRFIYDENSFDNGPAPSPPPYTSPPPGRPHNNRSHSPPGADSPQGSGGQSSNPDNGNKKALAAGPIVGIALGSSLVVFFAMLVIVFFLRKGKRKEPTTARTSSGSLPVSTDKDLSLTMLCSNCFGCGSLSAYPLEYWRPGSIVWLLSTPPYEERTVPANPNENRVFDDRTIFW